MVSHGAAGRPVGRRGCWPLFAGDDAGATSCDGGTGSGDGLASLGGAGASFPWTSTGAGDQLVGRGLGG